MNSPANSTILVVGATGSIGRRVVAEALAQGHHVRGLVRDAARARQILPPEAELVTGDVTRPHTLRPALEGIDAVILAHGVEGDEEVVKAVCYTGVRDLLNLLADPAIRIVLMSAVGVTARNGMNDTAHVADWKRRAERLVRASGFGYTIVRPGWFDENGPGELKLVFRQGDRHHTGTPQDGAISRSQIAQVLVAALTSPGAVGKTFELVAERGPATDALEPLFDGVPSDMPGALDAPEDGPNMPLQGEPQQVRDDLTMLREADLEEKR